MITVLTGENSYEREQAISRIVIGFDGVAERIDGSELQLRQLPDLLMGGTLFADKRLIIIKNLSENSEIWPVFGDWLQRISDDVSVVLVEPKPDKRTKTYKQLQKQATMQYFAAWTDRDTAKAEAWVAGEAATRTITMDKKSIRTVVARIGVDQWQLHYALEKLVAVDQVTPEVIEQLIDANPTENVFNLFEAALKGDATRVQAMVHTLRVAEDPYRLFGLLGSQVFQLAALVLADKPTPEVAKDIGAHPFALGKMAPYAGGLDRRALGQIVAAFAQADADMKTSAADPWLLIERALVKTALICR